MSTQKDAVADSNQTKKKSSSKHGLSPDSQNQERGKDTKIHRSDKMDESHRMEWTDDVVIKTGPSSLQQELASKAI